MVVTMAEDVVVVPTLVIRINQTQLYTRYASNQDILPKNAIITLKFFYQDQKTPTK